MKKLAIVLLLLASPAYAQQPQQGPADMALQINIAIGQMAISLVQKDKTIEALQKQIVDLSTKIKELEAKEDKK